MKIKDLILAAKFYSPFSVEFRFLILELGFDKDKVPYYLRLLNLYFGKSDEDREICLRKYKKLALKLKAKPQILKKLITPVNWRPTLVGNAAAILLREKRVQGNLIWRLENGSWVAPQIAVGIALIEEEVAKKKFQSILENASEESNPKTIMSVYAALAFLDGECAKGFENSELFNILKEKDSWDNSIEIVKQHWNFWKNIEPII